MVGKGATIQRVVLANANITGSSDVGGIAGENYGTVSYCYVAKDVVLNTDGNYVSWFGGIAGTNYSTISHCASAVQINNADGKENYIDFGGIAGLNYGTVEECLVLGATVPAGKDNTYGAICGVNGITMGTNIKGTLKNNYYSACTVGGNISNVGCGFSDDLQDVTKNDGAMIALASYKNAVETPLNLLAALPTSLSNTGAAVQALDLGFGPGKYPLQFVGHTFWKDGYWNTLCVPFDMSTEELSTTIATEGHPFYGAEFRELDVTGKYNDEGQPDVNGKHITGKDYSTSTVYLFFKPATEIVAGHPYLVKWSSGNDLYNPIINATIGSCRNAVTVRSED